MWGSRGFYARSAQEFADGEEAGSLAYMAPELIQASAYGRACDMWSLGVSFYKIRYGLLPFRHSDANSLKVNHKVTEVGQWSL